MNISQLRHSLKNKVAQEIAYLKSLVIHPEDYDEKSNSNELLAFPDTFAEAALPLLDMAKDARDTFRPYKRPRHVKRDALQLYYGAKNLIKGGIFLPCMAVTRLSVAVVPAIFAAVFYPFNANAARNFFSQTLGMLYIGGASLASSVPCFIRGATQIITSPLTLLRIGFRMAWFRDTPYRNDYETPKFTQALDNVNAFLRSDLPAYNSAEMLTALKNVYKKDKDRHGPVVKEIAAITRVTYAVDFDSITRIKTLAVEKIPQLSSAAQVHLFTNKNKKNAFSIPHISREPVENYVNSCRPAP